MAIGYGVACPKGPKRSTLKRRKERIESVVKQQVRAACVERDGDCRLARMIGHTDECGGESEWAHLEDKKRFKTRGMKPEDRHTTERSMMLCTRHHRKYDAHQLQIRFLTSRGADGWIEFTDQYGTLREAGSITIKF